MTMTSGYDGDFEFIVEATLGTTPATGQLQIPSDVVTRAHLDIHRESKRHYGIASHNAADTTYHTQAYTLTLEYELQQMKTEGAKHIATTVLEYMATHRTSGALGGVTSYLDCSAAAFRLAGGVVNKYSWDCSQDNAIHVTAEILGMTFETGANLAALTEYSGLTASAAIAETIERFEGSAITRAGKWSEGIKSGSFSIDNQVEQLYKVGAATPQTNRPKFVISEGECLVYASDGIMTPVDDLISGDEVSIVFASGTTASQSYKFTFGNASYDDVPIIYETGMTGMTSAIKWGGESVAFAAYS